MSYMSDSPTNLHEHCFDSVCVIVYLQEGIDYLKSQGKDTLLEMQGLAEPEASGSKPSLPHVGTMEATAKV